jgi:cytochrome c
MKKLFAISALVLFSAYANADPISSKGMAIASKSDCFACHAIDKKVVGPAFRDVALRYKNSPNVVDTLVHKVQVGGSGNWGAVPMAPHPLIPESDLKEVVTWILSISPK